MASAKVLLTADRTLMSNYRNNEFLGFGTTAPLNVVPEWFTMEQMNDLQMELLIKCLRHNIYWAKVIMKSYFKGKWYSRILSPLYWLFVKIVERKAKSVYNIPLKTETPSMEVNT
jgi:hypothetical protein